MGLVGIESLSMALSVTLVLSTGVIVGYMSISTGNKATDDTREVGDKGVADLFKSGEQNIEHVTAALLDEITNGVRSSFTSFLDIPYVGAKELITMMRSLHPDVSTNPDFLNETISPLVAAKIRGASFHGVNQIAVIALPFSPLAVSTGRATAPFGNGSWGGYVGSLITPMTEPEDESFLVFKTLGPDGKMAWNDTHITYGKMSERGDIIDDGPCVVPPNYTKGARFGKCEYLWEAIEQPGNEAYKEGQNRLLRNAVTPDGILDPANTVDWSPIVGIGYSLGVYAMASWTHPAMPNLMGPRQDHRVGQVIVGATTAGLGTLMATQHLPPDSLLYAVEKDPFTHKVGNLVGTNIGGFLATRVEVHGGEIYNIAFAVNVTNHNNTVISSHGMHILSSGGYDHAANTSSSLEPWVSPANNVTYFTKVKIVAHNRLRWYLVLLVPRQAMMATIDAANKKVHDDIVAAADDVDTTKDKEFATMLVVVVVCGVALLVISVVFHRIVIKPLLILEEEMALVAVMKLEEVDLNRPISMLGEVARMQRSFLKMVANLAEYRHYMPQSVLVDTEDETDSDSDGVAVRDGSTASGSESPAAGPNFLTTPTNVHLGGSTSNSNDSKKKSSGGRTPTSSRMVNLKKMYLQASGDVLKKKQVSFALFNIRDWHRVILKMHDQEVSLVHADIMSTVLTIVTSHKGVPDTFQGDRILSSFNSVRPVGSHRASAVASALAVSQRVSNTNEVRISAAVASGEARVGNMGCNGMKKFAHLTTVVPWIHVLERINCTLGTTVLIDQFTKQDIESTYHLRTIDLVDYPKRSRNIIRIFECMGEKTLKNEEWMYAIEGSDNPFTPWERCLDAVFAADWTRAATLLADLTDEPLFDRVKGFVTAKHHAVLTPGMWH
eukprot:Sspe_Gene.31497::Locus_15534_Transcript_1_1_Confidence_1.000_Length_2963::g.31497::m.31497